MPRVPYCARNPCFGAGQGLAVPLAFGTPVLWGVLFGLAALIGVALNAGMPAYRVLFPNSICYVLTSRRVLLCVQHPLSGATAFTFGGGGAASPKKKPGWLF